MVWMRGVLSVVSLSYLAYVDVDPIVLYNACF